MMDGVVHIAGPDVTIGARLRQRCMWCGAVLTDYDLANIAVPVEQLDEDGGFRPGTWPVGGLVLVDGGMTVVVQHEDGAQLPDNACDRLPETSAAAALFAAVFPDARRAGLEPVNVQVAIEGSSDFHDHRQRFRITGDLIEETPGGQAVTT